METVGAYEAKTHLTRLLERVAKGEKITLWCQILISDLIFRYFRSNCLFLSSISLTILTR
jgi:hypothetical protein